MKRNRLPAICIVSAILLICAVLFILLTRTQKTDPAFSENTATSALSETPNTSGPTGTEPEPTSVATIVPTPEPTPDPEVLRASGDNYEQGCILLELGLFNQARAYLSQVRPEDSANYSSAQEKLGECMAGIRDEYLRKAREAYDGTHYLKAQDILLEALSEFPGDPDISALLESAREARENPEPYTGPLYHVFFHSLIVYPELCFTGDGMASGYNDWMTTVYEFKRMLPELYDRGFTLVHLADLFERDASTGKMKRSELLLPKGQKPLVISVDDVSYYDYMENDGFAERLVLDGNGDTATLVRTPGGEEIITRDGDVVPILDDFVKSHPDFSINGAKGVLALTGYEGILGYATEKSNPGWEEQKAEARKVVERLKETGWSFACHSYTHKATIKDRTVTLDYVKYDTEKWSDEVGSIVGPTNLYISPFGAVFPESDPRMRYIVSQGYDIYCGVGLLPYIDLYKDYALMGRTDLDGFKMNYYKDKLNIFIDVDDVYDPARPPFNH